VLAGFGRVGRRVGEILTRADLPFVALEANPRVVKMERARGYPVYNGDVCQPGLLKAVGATGVAVIIVTLNDPENAKEVVSTLRGLYPDTTIFARGHDLNVCRDLKRLGASGVVSENFESSVELASMTLTQIGIEDTVRDEMLTRFRQKYEADLLS
jgi:voltage-gated potassium channel Kch